jgi:hypothetical protein
MLALKGGSVLVDECDIHHIACQVRCDEAKPVAHDEAGVLNGLRRSWLGARSRRQKGSPPNDNVLQVVIVAV